MGLGHDPDHLGIIEGGNQVEVVATGEAFFDAILDFGVEVDGEHKLDFGVLLGEGVDGFANFLEGLAKAFAAMTGNQD